MKWTSRLRSAVRASVTTLVTALWCAAPAWSHHSFAMFDHDKFLTLDGTIRNVEWVNPHSWIFLDVADPDKPGTAVTWAIEGASPGIFSRQGFTRKDFAAGSRMKIDIHPNKDGSMAGQFLRVTFPDGRVVGDLSTPIDVLRGKGAAN